LFTEDLMDINRDGAERQWRLTREALDKAGLTVGQVWLRYFSLTGNAGEYEVDAYLNGLLVLPTVQRDLVSHAVNELIDEKAHPQKAPYSYNLGGREPSEEQD
jgi:hypothetical protein